MEILILFIAFCTSIKASQRGFPISSEIISASADLFFVNKSAKALRYFWRSERWRADQESNASLAEWTA